MGDFVKRRRKKILVATIILIVAMAAGLMYFIANYAPMASNVAVISVLGPISVYGDGASSQRIVGQIEDADANPVIKAIIIEINSPGGTVVASEEIATAIKNAKKPIIAWMREVAASGGYWIAATADHIVADPATITGSIGVTSSYLQYSGLMEKYGVEYEEVTFGAYKGAGSPYKKLSDAERFMMQNNVNKIGEMFVKHVAEARGLSEGAVRSFATGQIILGTDALDMGLVDSLGGKTEVENVVKELANINEIKAVKKDGGIKELLDKLLNQQAYWFGRGFGEVLKPDASANGVMDA